MIDLPNIFDVWAALRGGLLRHARGQAFWRRADGFNVSIDPKRNIWFDFARGEGGGVLDLVRRVRGGSRGDAIRWLSERFNIPLNERTRTPADRRRRAEARRRAPLLAWTAWWWWTARIAELEAAKAGAVSDTSIDIDLLSCTSSELYRLQGLAPEGVIRAYLQFRAERPVCCRELEHIGRAEYAACEASVRAIITKLARKQQEACRAA